MGGLFSPELSLWFISPPHQTGCKQDVSLFSATCHLLLPVVPSTLALLALLARLSDGFRLFSPFGSKSDDQTCPIHPQNGSREAAAAASLASAAKSASVQNPRLI